MRPKMLLLDEPCDKAKEIFSTTFDLNTGWEYPDIIYTGLTPVETIVPVCCPCTGIDHVKSPHIIHLDEVWKRGDGVMVTSTAEHTWSLVLGLAKLKKMQLSNKHIGIIGYGRIGQQVEEYAKAFNMFVDAYDKFKKPFIGYEDNGFYASNNIEKILRESDIITLHVPLNDETKGMIGKSEFDLMKHGALLVNTSRPEIVDKFSLIDNLYGGKVGGYADDFSNYWNFNHENVIQTPHIAGNCLEAREATDTYIATKTIEWWRTRAL